MMNVTHFEAGPFPAESSRSKCAEPSFMCQFSQRIRLVHELGQLATAEEFLDGCSYRPYIYQRLGSDDVDVLYGHPFLYDPLHPGKTDPELILQELTHTAQSSVAEMIYIIILTHFIAQIDEVIDGCYYIFLRDMFWNEQIRVFPDRLFEFLFALILIHELFEYAESYFFRNTGISNVKIDKRPEIYSPVTNYPYLFPFNIEVNGIDA